jgi:hypothetical protein
LHPFISSHVPGLIQFHDGPDKGPAIASDDKPSCPSLSLVKRAGFVVMTIRQRNNPPYAKVQTQWERKGETGVEQSQMHPHFL